MLGTKGGVGKSTVSMGIAIWFSTFSKEKVLLIDGDMHVRSVELKMCSPNKDTTLADVLERKKPWREAVYVCDLTLEGKQLYPNLSVLPARGRFLPKLSGNTYEYLKNVGGNFARMMTKLKKEFQYIVIDTPASFGKEHLILVSASDVVVYVCEANDDSINATLSASDGLGLLMGMGTGGVILSRAPDYLDLSKRSIWVKKAERIAPLLGTIPSDTGVDRSFRENLPVVAAFPDGPASLAMKSIAKRLWKMKPTGVEQWARIERAIEKSPKL